MEDNLITLEEIHLYLLQNGGKVRNRDVVRHFKNYLTDPVTRDENRSRFKSYINSLAQTKSDGDEKVIHLKAKYSSYDPPPASAYNTAVYSPAYDPMNSIGIPLSPAELNFVTSPSRPQPPPYRPPPPPYSSMTSLDSVSIGSLTSLNDLSRTPQAPPRERKRDSEKSRSISEEVTPKKPEVDPNTEDKSVSVKERTQKFNRLASVEDELSPRQPKSAEKENRKPNWGADQEDGLNLTPLEPKKCMEWYVTASRGDYQELLKLANNEPRLVSKKDPFTTVLHWGAKYGNADIIKTFAGKYRVDVNGKTGYTPLHISAQFGHKDVFKLLIEVYKADPGIRDYSGRTADYYFLAKEQKEGQIVTLRKIKGRKKLSDKEGFLRIGSLNVRVKKTTEAFSNFLGVGSGASISPLDSVNEKILKGWGSVDNVNKDSMGAPKSYGSKKKYKKGFESGGSSTPSTPKTSTKNFNLLNCNDSDSDTAAGFDSNWKH